MPLPALCLVQASSRSWSGDRDYCVNRVEGVPVVIHTLVALRAAFPNAPITLIVPAFDRDAGWKALLAAHGWGDVGVLHGHDGSPLARMVDATAALEPEAVVLRIDGLNMFVDPRSLSDMAAALATQRVDCYRMPDDYPPLLAADFFRVGALRRARARLREEDAFHIHVKHFLARDPEFTTAFHPGELHYEEGELRHFRAQSVAIYHEEREHEEAAFAVPAGNTLSFHYELAEPRMQPGRQVLDIACGGGFGAATLAEHAADVIAGDLDPTVVTRARERYQSARNIDFRVMDALATGLPDQSVDYVTSFETIEHVPDRDAYLAELARILVPDGRLFLSTPQNRHGRVPLNPWHQREFSAAELADLLSTRFDIESFIGIKQGRVIVPNDPIGTNSFVVARPRDRRA